MVLTRGILRLNFSDRNALMLWLLRNMQGTRSVYFPQRCMNKPGLLGYAGPANNNCIIALQVETADCIRNVSLEGSLLFVTGCC